MTAHEPSPEELARTWAGIAGESFAEAARYLRSVPEDEWGGPSGAELWTIRKVAGHIAGEAVWFSNLIRGVTKGEEPHPSSLYEELNELPPDQMANRIEEAAHQIPVAVEEAIPEHIESLVDMGFAKMPIWRATFISALEGVFHGWDAHARRELHATIPEKWAVPLASPLTDWAPDIAHQKYVESEPGTYVLQGGDEIGATTVIARDGKLSLERGAVGTPDVTIYVTPDEYVRLIVGRLDLKSPERVAIPMEGDRQKARGLSLIFHGIANGD